VPDNLKPAVPEKAALRVVALFLTEYIPGVKNEYALMETACGGGPLKISLPDLQVETFIFALHCLDRAVFARWGPKYRSAFMDCAFGIACEWVAATLPAHTRELLLSRFEELCAFRHIEYSGMRVLMGDDEGPKGFLPYEFGKRICFDAGVYDPEVVSVMVESATSIFVMMMEIADEL
jgi:hypothetical protein